MLLANFCCVEHIVEDAPESVTINYVSVKCSSLRVVFLSSFLKYFCDSIVQIYYTFKG